MESLQFTTRETQLAKERRRKFQGTAKVNLDDIYFPFQEGRQLDQKNVNRLCDIFREEGCENLTIEHRVPAIISQHQLQAAIERANIAASTLLSRTDAEIPHLQFPSKQLLALHGRHRVAAGREVLSLGHRWWAVDLYLDDLCDDLKTSLIEEYSNEKPPSDGEIYRRIRQYACDGNLHGELRWRARLCANGRTRLDALTKNTCLRHAFDRVLAIPGHWSAMRISMLHRVIAVRCDEEIAYYLNYVAEFWSVLVGHDTTSVTRIDQDTVEKLQLLVPCVESPSVHGLVLSGQVFSEFDESERTEIWRKLRSFNGLIPSLYSFFEDFKCFESWAHCLDRLFTVTKSTVRRTLADQDTRPNDGHGTIVIQTSESTFSNRIEPTERRFDISYRQLWLYAQRHYPQMPRDPKRKKRLAKPRSAAADEYVVSDMAFLARRLGFQSDEITNIIEQSPDRLIATQALLRARKPDRYAYDVASFNSLVDRVVECFDTASPRTVETASPVLASPSLPPKARCGHPSEETLLQDSRLLFLDQMHAEEVPTRVTSLFVRRCVYLAFFGPRPDFSQEQQILQSPSTSMPGHGQVSSIFVSDVDMLDNTPNGQSPHIDGQQRAPAGPEGQRQRTGMPAAENDHLQHCQNAAVQELTRRAEEAESQMAAQAAELERLRQEAAAGPADTAKRLSRVDENLIERDVEITDEFRDLDEILQADADQRAIGEEEPVQWDADRMAHERAAALAQLETRTEDVRSQQGNEPEPTNVHRPVTELDASYLMAAWETPQGHMNANSGPVSPETSLETLEAARQEVSETAASIEARREENILAGSIPSTSSTHRAGATKKRTQQKTKEKGVQKTPTTRLAMRNANYAIMRDEAIGVEIEGTAEGSQSSEARPVDERIANTRQVRFDVPDEGAVGHVNSEHVRPRPLTQWRFQEMASNNSGVIPDQLAEETDGPSHRKKIPITFYIYVQGQWKADKVLEIEPTNQSSLERAVRTYQQRGMIVHDKDMRTISARTSFRAATRDKSNILLVISRKTKEKMDERRLRQIKPPTIMTE